MSPYLDHTTLRFFNNSLASSPLLRSRRSNKRQEHHYCRQLLWKKKRNNTSKRYRITQCKFDSYAFITNAFHTINANFRVVPPLKKKEEEAVFHILCHSSKQQCKQTTHLKPYFWKIRDKKQLGSWRQFYHICVVFDGPQIGVAHAFLWLRTNWSTSQNGAAYVLHLRRRCISVGSLGNCAN